jgi:alkaline phosphatase
MVEGSQVDWAGHANDPIYMITDFLAFDEAFKAAIDFARADGNTLVIAFPDHDTGGMTIGHNYTEHGYTATTVEDIVEPLQNMTISAYGVAQKIDELGGANIDTIKSGISQWWGLEISDEDAQAILDYMDYAGVYLDYAISHVVSERYTYFGWTTHGHTGTDVPIWSYGPGKPVGTRDNTDLAKRSAVALGFTFGTIQPLLYQEVGKHFPGYTMDTSDPENPVLKVGDCSMPVSKDILVVDSLKATYTMPGLTVHAPATGKVYVSLVAVAIMDAINTSGSAIAANEAAFAAQVEWRLRELAESEGIDPSIVLAQLD